jgi:copper(I)-binding protein
MTTELVQRATRAAFTAFVLAFSAAVPLHAIAHGSVLGDIKIGHPYATPSVPGASNGVAFIADLENTGKQADRLLRVSTPVADHAEIHTMNMDNGGVMRMREVADVPVAPGVPVRMHPGDGIHFMLMGLKQPLKDGDSFPMTMQFERAGQVEVKVIVQAAKPAMGEMEHKH